MSTGCQLGLPRTAATPIWSHFWTVLTICTNLALSFTNNKPIIFCNDTHASLQVTVDKIDPSLLVIWRELDPLFRRVRVCLANRSTLLGNRTHYKHMNGRPNLCC